jgi:hypothetical protein
MKTILMIMIIISQSILSSPYIEYKNTVPLIENTEGYQLYDTTDHLRFGYKLDNNMYFEAGPMTHGKGFELGYKFNNERWTFKGKIEGNHNESNVFKSKVQTEIRYTFE